MKNDFIIITVLMLLTFKIEAQPSIIDNQSVTVHSWESAVSPPILRRAYIVQNGINLGFSLSTPVNSARENAPFGGLIDLNYIYQSRKEIAYGIATGYGIYFEEEADENWGPLGYDDDFRYIPIAAALRYPLPLGISAGVDVGYAIGLGKRWDGGFYFRPLLGYNVSPSIQLNMSYTSITDDWTWSAVNIGCTINLNQGSF